MAWLWIDCTATGEDGLDYLNRCISNFKHAMAESIEEWRMQWEREEMKVFYNKKGSGRREEMGTQTLPHLEDGQSMEGGVGLADA